MRVAYLGPEGTYAEEAAWATVPGGTYTPCPNIESVFAAVADGSAERGLVPIENVIQGPVTETLDNLFAHAKSVTIADMRVIQVRHAFGALGGPHEIEVVRSRDIALKQCSRFLNKHYPDVQLQDWPSTSGAVESVAREGDKRIAAIGSVRAMEHYDLPVVARDIGNVVNNKTRFVLLGPASLGVRAPTRKDATAFVVYPPSDRVGILEDILDVISNRYGLSLSSIHSRPDTRGGFRFYMEVEGHLEDTKVADCIDTLRERLAGDRVDIRVFGSYPRCPFVEPRIKTIGIVGGTGVMGQWLERLFAEAGYGVLIAGRSTDLTYEECVAHSDVVLINVPIKNTVEVIEQVAPLMQDGQLLVDNTSIKTQPIEAMVRSVPKGVEVLGMHTVFGPNAESLARQNVVFTRTSLSAELAAEFENIFYKYGARITYTDAPNHDRQMAFHQNLEHFTKLVLAQVLTERFAEPAQMDSFSSPNSRASLATMGRVLHTDLELLTEIQALNVKGPEMIEAFVTIAEKLSAAISLGDMDALRKSVEKSAGALGHQFLAEMLERSRE